MSCIVDATELAEAVVAWARSPGSYNTVGSAGCSRQDGGNYYVLINEILN